ncbi:MAG: glycine--tRNA ligase [Candidatus Saccharimonadales bacterium]
MTKQKTNASLETLTSLAKRRGFIYQGSDIYGGLAGTWDYGPLGVQLKRNMANLWWQMFVESREDVYGLDSAVLMSQKVWEASGHTGAGFADLLVEDVVTKQRYRADHLLEDNGIEDAESMSLEEVNKAIKDQGIKSPDGNDLSEARQFNLMFETSIGATSDDVNKIYLRPETAQGMFVNFKNVVDSIYPDLPFGLAQIGKAFRNEISPREFIFRTREFEIMELEYFILEKDWEKYFENWRLDFYNWCEAIGLDKQRIHEVEVPEADRAHYSKRTIDFEYEFDFGVKEIAAVAYRTDFDLSNHMSQSGANLHYPIKGTNEKVTPHVIEPTWGLDRNLLAVLAASYCEDEQGGDKRSFLKLPSNLAPIKVAVFPLLKNKSELVDKAKQVHELLHNHFGSVVIDDNGNIGKRYRRQDEIGTPYCVTIDFDTLEDGTVTLRDRDSTEQVRVNVDKLIEKIDI